MTPAKKSLVSKLAEVMGEVGHVPKRGRNDYHHYDYVTEADLVDAVREKLATRQVMILPGIPHLTERAAKTKSGETTITTARMTFTFYDGESGETIEVPWVGQGDDPSDKGAYKAMTGALKYFVMKTFLIPTGDDPEQESPTSAVGSAPARIPNLSGLPADTDKRLGEMARAADARAERKAAAEATEFHDPTLLSGEQKASLLKAVDFYVEAGGSGDMLDLKLTQIGVAEDAERMDEIVDVLTAEQGHALFQWLRAEVEKAQNGATP